MSDSLVSKIRAQQLVNSTVEERSFTFDTVSAVNAQIVITGVIFNGNGSLQTTIDLPNPPTEYPEPFNFAQIKVLETVGGDFVVTQSAQGVSFDPGTQLITLDFAEPVAINSFLYIPGGVLRTAEGLENSPTVIRF